MVNTRSHQRAGGAVRPSAGIDGAPRDQNE